MFRSAASRLSRKRIGAASGGIGGSVGVDDNGVPRADGVGGTTLQSSAWAISDAGALSPKTNDGGALGTASLGVSDLFFAPGAVVNFANGDVTVTHSTDTLTVAGGKFVTAAFQANGDFVVDSQGSGANNFTLSQSGRRCMFSFDALGGFNGLEFLSNSFSNAGTLTQSNNTLASWFVDIGGRNGGTPTAGDAFTVGRVAAGGSYGTSTNAFFQIFSTGGANFGTPTGGDKGVGTVNAKGVYDDNTLLTDVVQEYVRTGGIDLKRWDDTVAPHVEPAFVERRTIPVAGEEVEINEVLEKADDGTYVVKLVERRRPAVLKMLTPVYDESGNGIGAVLETQFDEVAIPEKRTPREHYGARIFKGLVDGGLDPRDPVSVAAYVAAHNCLPGMPRESEWEHGKYSMGELQTRSTLAMEIMAQALIGLTERVVQLEGRIPQGERPAAAKLGPTP